MPIAATTPNAEVAPIADMAWRDGVCWDPSERAGPLGGGPVHRGYLDTATVGIPAERTRAAMHRGIEAWGRGIVGPDTYEPSIRHCRELFSALVGRSAADIAVGSQVSVVSAMVAASLRPRSTVLVPDLEFTSMVTPFEIAGHEVVTVRAGELIDRIDATCDLVAFSAVQSATGEVIDIESVADAASAAGAAVYCDATQAAGWLPLDAGHADVMVVSAYKWIGAPRGTVLMAAAPDARVALLTPIAAAWYAGATDRAMYGPGIALHDDARRFDVSPAWMNWLGTEAALSHIVELGVERIHDHDIGLANALREAIGLPPGTSAIVTVAATPEATARLHRAGLRFAHRHGRVRMAFHHGNDLDDVDRAADVLASRHLRPEATT